MKKKVQGVFFDLYGTLLIYGNMEQAWSEWVNTYYSLVKHKTSLSFEAFAKACEGVMSGKVFRNEPSDLTTYETRLAEHCRRLSISLTRSELAEIADQTPRSWQKHISLPAEVHETLKSLKQTHKLVLITNFEHARHVKYVLSRCELDGHFEHILISDEVGYEKPDRRIFELALQRANLSAETVLYVGDNLKDDVEGARTVGMTPVWVKYDTYTTVFDYGALPEEKETVPDVLKIHNLSELPALISRLEAEDD